MDLSDHVGLNTSSGQGRTQRAQGERRRRVNRGVDGKMERHGTDVEKKGMIGRGSKDKEARGDEESKKEKKAGN